MTESSDDQASPRRGSLTTLQLRTLVDAHAIADAFEAGGAVLDMQYLDDEMAKRLADFIAGVSRLGHGTIERLSNGVFVLRAPT